MFTKGIKKILFLIIILAVAHVIGMQGPYYSTWYYDDIMHFSGGAIVAVMAVEFLFRLKLKISFLKILFSIFFIAFLWELHEYIWDKVLIADYGIPVMQLGAIDTLSDFLFAFLGGTFYYFGYFYYNKTRKKSLTYKANEGYTMIEVLVVVTILGIIATMVIVNLFGVRSGASDTKRIADLNQIGRFLSFGCLTPIGGPGEYDLNTLLQEYRTNYPQYANNIPKSIADPKSGSEALSNYKYIVDINSNCVLYANLENEEAKVDLPSLTDPTPGGGRGVLQSATVGVNGTHKYYQISNQ